MTGAEFFQYLNQSIDKNYSEYVQDDEGNRLVLTAMYNLAEKLYRTNFTQKTNDELNNLIVTEYTASVLSDKINLFDFQIDSVTLVGTTVTVTTVRRHFLSAGDNVTIAGVTGTTVTNINGTFAVVTTPTDTSFTYTSPGAVLTAYTDNTGTVATANMLQNYYHLLSLKANFPTGISKNVSGAKSGTTTQFTIVKHNFRTGDVISVTGVNGITGTFSNVVATVINKNTISVPVTSTGTYVRGGVAVLVQSNYVKPYNSDMKSSTLYEPTFIDPRYEMSEGYIKLYPTGASSATVDYLITPPVTIDVTDTVIDLELYFNNKFLFRLVDEATYLFGMESRDEGRAQTALQDLTINE